MIGDLKGFGQTLSGIGGWPLPVLDLYSLASPLCHGLDTLELRLHTFGDPSTYPPKSIFQVSRFSVTLNYLFPAKTLLPKPIISPIKPQINLNAKKPSQDQSQKKASEDETTEDQQKPSEDQQKPSEDQSQEPPAEAQASDDDEGPWVDWPPEQPIGPFLEVGLDVMVEWRNLDNVWKACQESDAPFYKSLDYETLVRMMEMALGPRPSHVLTPVEVAAEKNDEQDDEEQEDEEEEEEEREEDEEEDVQQKEGEQEKQAPSQEDSRAAKPKARTSSPKVKDCNGIPRHDTKANARTENPGEAFQVCFLDTHVVHDDDDDDDDDDGYVHGNHAHD